MQHCSPSFYIYKTFTTNDDEIRVLDECTDNCTFKGGNIVIPSPHSAWKCKFKNVASISGVFDHCKLIMNGEVQDLNGAITTTLKPSAILIDKPYQKIVTKNDTTITCTDSH